MKIKKVSLFSIFGNKKNIENAYDVFIVDFCMFVVSNYLYKNTSYRDHCSKLPNLTRPHTHTKKNPYIVLSFVVLAPIVSIATSLECFYLFFFIFIIYFPMSLKFHLLGWFLHHIVICQKARRHRHKM